MPEIGRRRMPREVEIKVKDEREITVPIPADAAATKKLADFVSTATNEGFCLAGVDELTTGQRDPYTVGARLIFRRSI